MVVLYQPLSFWMQLAGLFFTLSGISGDLLVIRTMLFLAYSMLFINSVLGSPFWPNASNFGGIALDSLLWSVIGMYVHGCSLVGFILDERKVDLTDDEAAAYLHAAVRESREEVGLWPDPTEVLDGGRFAAVGHWITPVDVPRRYDTRFFLARHPGGAEARVEAAEVRGGPLRAGGSCTAAGDSQAHRALWRIACHAPGSDRAPRLEPASRIARLGPSRARRRGAIARALRLQERVAARRRVLCSCLHASARPVGSFTRLSEVCMAHRLFVNHTSH